MSERIMSRPLDPKADDEWDRIFRKGKYAEKKEPADLFEPGEAARLPLPRYLGQGASAGGGWIRRSMEVGIRRSMEVETAPAASANLDVK